jgi:predicted alpha-1,2-mannosidase
MNYKLTSFLIILALVATTGFAQRSNRDYTRYVNPFIGTGGHGHTYPGPSLPFGMMQLGPDTRLTGWDGCSGYHYSDSVVYGFSHTHLSGVGVPDYGDILFMPTTGKPEFLNARYASPFQKKNERATAGYYATRLDKYGIDVALTTTKRVGLHQYTFPATRQANIIIDLKHRDEVLDSWIEIVSDTEIRGFRRSKAWATDQRIYFYARFSKPFKISGIALNDTLKEGLKKGAGKNVKLYLQYDTKEGEQVLVKVATSAVSPEGALRNLDAEMKGFDFKATVAAAKKAWNLELSKIDAESDNPKQLTTYYTALYHAMLAPNLFMDVDGQYLGLDKQVHKADGFDYYTVFSLWDTHRTEHPLLTLIDRKRTLDFIRTFLAMYDQGKLLPVWELAANETYCMIGNHAIPVIVDAYAKGIRDFDAEKALRAMKDAVNRKQFGIDVYVAEGAVTADKEHESASKTVEYAYDDWCIAQFAKMLGHTTDYNLYSQRAQYWKNVFDPETGFIRARQNGGFWSPFNPTEVNNNYTEGNAWHYSFSTQQDVNTHMAFLGGEAAYQQKLDELFTSKEGLSGREQSDITGLIGQYAHGNEPSHHMAYLFNFTNHPEKAQYYLQQIYRDQYSDQPDGLSGNEDCGQMSAWLVMSAMGYYPLSPGNNRYLAGSPWFKKLTVHLENGKQIIINAPDLDAGRFYTAGLKLNGQPYAKLYFDYKDLANGGTLDFSLSAKPVMNYLNNLEKPVMQITDNQITPNPSINGPAQIFKGKQQITLTHALKEVSIYYTLDGTEPGEQSIRYTAPFEISKNTTVRAIACRKGFANSFPVFARFELLDHNYTIQVNTPVNPSYTGGGNNALIDGARGQLNWRLGNRWQGFWGKDMEAIVDMGVPKKVNSVSIGALQDVNAWIIFPPEVIFYTSDDAINFKEAGTVKSFVNPQDYTRQIKDFTVTIGAKCRYVKVIAKNYGLLGEWHEGAGGMAHSFFDEITIR